jgi:hypothetical protein
MGLNPKILEKHRKAVFDEFLGKQFRIYYVGFDWKMDKKVLGISDPFCFKRDGNLLRAAPYKKKLFSGNDINSRMLGSGVIECVEVRRQGSSNLFWVSRTPSHEFRLNCYSTYEDMNITLSTFTIRLDL